jgi:hypothetical protein
MKIIEYLYTICGVFIGCGEGVCVGARSRLCQWWVHSLGIFMGVLILVIHTLFLAMSRLAIVILCYINNPSRWPTSVAEICSCA